MPSPLKYTAVTLVCGILCASFLTLLPPKVGAAPKDILFQILSIRDLPPGFGQERKYDYASERGDHATASLTYKAKHPMTLEVEIVEWPNLSSVGYLWEGFVERNREFLVETDLGLGEKSALTRKIIMQRGARKTSMQKIQIFYRNWELHLRLSHYDHPSAQAYSDGEAGQLLKGLAKTVFSRFLDAFESDLEIEAGAGDVAGSALSDGDVVQHVTDLNRPDPFSIKIRGAGSGGVEIGLQRWHRHLVTLAGPGAEASGNGWRLLGSEDPLAVTFSFDGSALRQFRENFPGGPAVVLPVDVKSGANELRFFLQVTDWQLIVTRFEVKQRGAESIRQVAVRGEGRAVRDYRFNDYIEHTGNLWDTWAGELEPLVRVRPGAPIPANASVVMGWAKNEETGHTFFTAESDPSEGGEKVPDYNAEAELIADFDLEILLDPKAATRRSAAGDEWEVDDDVLTNDPARQRDIWREFQMEDFSITVHEVGPPGEGMRSPAREASALPGPVAVLRGEKWLSAYANLKEADSFSGEIRYDLTAPVYYFGPLRKAGVYEVRLRMTVARMADIEDSRTVDVALRINAVRGRFHVRLLQWTSERGR